MSVVDDAQTTRLSLQCKYRRNSPRWKTLPGDRIRLPLAAKLKRRYSRKMPKKIRGFAVLRSIDLERRLLRVYRSHYGFSQQLQSSTPSFSFDEFYKKLQNLLEKWGCSVRLKSKISRSWLADWCVKYGICGEQPLDNIHDADSLADEVTVKLEVPPDDAIIESDADLEIMLRDYQEDEIYLCFCFQFCWSSLPDRTLGTDKGTAIMAKNDDVWLLMAANRSGRHRTRLCVIGKEWRPACLQQVNMLSQPVVYAGGGEGMITADLFAWWFHQEFSPGALAMNRNVILLAETKSYLPCDQFISENSRARFIALPGNTLVSDDSGCMIAYNRNVIQTEFRIRYAKLLLSLMLVEDSNSPVQMYLSQFTLKDAFPLLHHAWLTIRISTFAKQFRKLLSRFCSPGEVSDNAWSTTNSDVFGSSDEQEHSTEDGRLLLELQWVAHDLGLEITDEDLIKWAYTGTVQSSVNTASTVASCFTYESSFCPSKISSMHSAEGRNTQVLQVPTAREAMLYLSKALMWMETEPLDPNCLLFLRNLIVIAKQARKVSFYLFFL